MKRILITGANSYIGGSFERYIKENFAEKYEVDTVDMIDENWKNKSFSGYDTVFHVAGIAHQRETKYNAYLYYEVNRDLTIWTAKKAKEDGVSQFVFLSSMSVYGLDVGAITKQIDPKPKNHYGKSKLQAEEGLVMLADEDFKVCILRPPMVYGKNARGNFQVLFKLVKKSPIFPQIRNQRSMIYIENLCSFIRLCIDKELNDIYFPQNREYVATLDIVESMSRVLGKKINYSRVLGIGIKVFMPFVARIRKAFGSLVYTDTMEEFNYNYCLYSFEESIQKSIK